jgi:tetratricopeptide (TPR) repeat protein
MNPRRTGRLLLIIAVISLGGCVYYNTFYFARRHFQTAEMLRKRAEENERPLPPQALESYQKSLQYAARVLMEHPDSKWVEEALLLSQKALYRQGEVAASTRKGLELLEHFPESQHVPECRLYLARGLLILGEALNAAGEASRAATQLTGRLRAEAMLLHALALGVAERYEEARGIFDSMIADPKTPPNIALQAKLELQKLLEEQGEYDEGVAILEDILSDQGLTLTTRQETTILLIDLLLKVGDIPAVEEQVKSLEELDDSGYYTGVIKYYRGVLADRRGSHRQATNEMVLSLNAGVTADWEARIRLDLGAHLERGEDYFTAGTEYRAVRSGLGTLEQQQRAAKRADIIMRFLTLRSLVEKVEEEISFRDPRNVGANRGVAVNRPPPRAVEEDVRRRHREDPDEEVEQEDRPTVQEERVLTVAEQLGDVPPGMYLFLLAEHFALEMASPNSAVTYLELLAERHPDSDMVPRALFAITEWAPENEEGVEHRESAVTRLVEEFADSRWTYYYRLRLGEEPGKPTDLRAHDALVEAERQVDPLAEPAQWQSVIPAFYEVAERFPSTESARRAELAAARLLELGAGPPDSARAAYERIVERYPDYPEARIAAERIGSPTSAFLPDPQEARKQAIEQELGSWDRWFGTQTAAKVVRLQPRGQAAQLAFGGRLGIRATSRPGQGRTAGSDTEPPPRRPPPGRPPPSERPPPDK